MKKISALAVAMLLLAGCVNFDLSPCGSDKEETPNFCPTVNADAVPEVVTSVFKELYPEATVTTWFNKDNTAYCALFSNNSVKKLVQIKNNGTFVSEESVADPQQSGNCQGHNGCGSQNNSDPGCVCDTGN